MLNYLRLSSPKFSYLNWSADFFLLAGIGVSLMWLYPAVWDLQFTYKTAYFKVIVLAGFMLIFFSKQIYKSWRTNLFWDIIVGVSWVWIVIMSVIVFGLFLMKESSHISRIWFMCWWLGCWFSLISYRLIVYLLLRKIRKVGFNFKKLLIIGTSQTSNRVVGALNNSSWSGFNLLGVIQVDEIESFMGLSDKDQPNEIWICLPMSDELSIRLALKKLRFSVANIRLVPDLFSLKLVNHGVSKVLGIPMLDLSKSPVTGLTNLLKSTQDIITSFFIIVLTSPIFLFIALAIKISSNGPILFKQKRLGWNSEEIYIYKFRTMYIHQEDNEKLTQASKNDKRVTSLGKFLRKTSLDELPQFFNVLQGRMSIVGPRPHAIEHNQKFKDLVPRYMLRHKVKPGITGWAQIHGYRGETDTIEKMEMRLEFDLFYIENMTFWLDLKIILITVFKGFTHKNAY